MRPLCRIDSINSVETCSPRNNKPATKGGPVSRQAGEYLGTWQSRYSPKI